MKLFLSTLFLGVLQLTLAGGPTPSNKPNLDTCNDIIDLNGPNAENYIKSLCFVDFRRTQPEELQYCNGIGMRLFTIKVANEIPAVASYLTNNFPPGWSFYLNANRVNNAWVASLPTEPVSSAVTSVIVDEGQDCLFVWANSSIITDRCDFAYTFVCEFNKNWI
jgi:hypothetical protein